MKFELYGLAEGLGCTFGKNGNDIESTPEHTM
jgi:hypothetical protein